MTPTDAIEVVHDPLTGAKPTWRMDDDPDFWETAAALGWEPSELDARVQPFPDAEGPVVEAEALTDDEAAGLAVVS